MAQDRSNVLFVMAGRMQGRVLRPDSACKSPRIQALASRGVRFENAYTPCGASSPARASLMTGLLPHSHGVLTLTHCVDSDQACLREVPHWAQSLATAGYRTGHFGPWHVERSGKLYRFGWQSYADLQSAAYEEQRKRVAGDTPSAPKLEHVRHIDSPPGYRHGMLYAVTDEPPEQRPMGIVTAIAQRFLDEALRGHEPWCCFVSYTEPEHPFVAGQAAFLQYDPDALDLPANAHDDLSGRPGAYRKLARIFSGLDDRQRREAMACYYASISELDAMVGRIIEQVEQAGQLNNTIVVMGSDHGEMMGAHGLFCTSTAGYEEVYNVPLVMAGPGLAKGQTSLARVGLHDLCPTLLELVNLKPIGQPDSRSFAAVARDPRARPGNFTTGFAEYFGTRYLMSQRIAWDGQWKLVHNGFDFDELYNLERDSGEMENLAEEPEYRERLKSLMRLIWQRVRETNDPLQDADYPGARLAPFGPLIVGE